MKKSAIVLIALGPFVFNCSVWAKGLINRIKDKQSIVKSITKPRRESNDQVFQKILENNKKIYALLLQRSSEPVIWEGRSKILTGKVVRGTLLNSINSTNLASPVLILAHEGQGLAPNTKFSCQGITQNERVFTLCNKMISSNKEISITAQVLNRDGSSGLLGDFDDGKEDLIMGAIASNFAQGILSVAQGRLASPFGAIRDDSVKNQILQGGIESGKTTSDILLEEMKTKQPIVTINAGEEVLVYFMEAVNEN